MHGVIDQEGQLALVVLDLRDPSDPSATDAPVRISAPEGTGELAPKGWTLKNASQLTGTALAATESSLHGAAPVTGSLSGAVLERADPLDLASSPGRSLCSVLSPSKATDAWWQRSPQVGHRRYGKSGGGVRPPIRCLRQEPAMSQPPVHLDLQRIAMELDFRPKGERR